MVRMRVANGRASTGTPIGPTTPAPSWTSFQSTTSSSSCLLTRWTNVKIVNDKIVKKYVGMATSGLSPRRTQRRGGYWNDSMKEESLDSSSASTAMHSEIFVRP